jgi:hypothetical protein
MSIHDETPKDSNQPNPHDEPTKDPTKELPNQKHKPHPHQDNPFGNEQGI